ncbi:PAS domain-containing protein [candidate division KSB1 bacterium]|nr:PAS domain-containing protein [candidate division KSB1 bacterium]
MISKDLLFAFMDSLKEPFLFADLNHTVLYMNSAAKKYYSGGEKLLNTNLLDCHDADSNRQIQEIFDVMRHEGLDEHLITVREKYNIYMRAVRDRNGEFIGYYERFENKLLQTGETF